MVPHTTWPELRYEDWKPTCTALHLWTQIVGKARLAQTPWINHSWHATLYLTARGLTTSTIPVGARTFQVDFDFIDDMLRIVTSDGGEATFPLAPCSVAEFHGRFLGALAELRLDVTIHDRPSELPEAVPFADDTAPRPYDADAVRRFWRAMLHTERVFVRFRSGFLGKVSPVHLFWGGLDLAVTRFRSPRATASGGAPNMPKAVNVEAYSHEVSSAGFWPEGTVPMRPSTPTRTRSPTATNGSGLTRRCLRFEPPHVHPALRGGEERARPRCRLARILAEHLPSRGRPRGLESGGARMLHRRAACRSEGLGLH